jgi:hypothetical protein
MAKDSVVTADPVPKYQMTISRLTVDKLGVKLYDRVAAVIAELVANSYDADATEVVVEAPMDELLATKSAGKLFDKNYAIVVKDNGIGMMPEEVNAFYLKVGAERRADPKRGDTSKTDGRKVMGRKGVGKLAPFGVSPKIEVITSGGDPTMGKDEYGTAKKGYVTAHVILDRAQIMHDTDSPYHPDLPPWMTPALTLELSDFEKMVDPEAGAQRKRADPPKPSRALGAGSPVSCAAVACCTPLASDR